MRAEQSAQPPRSRPADGKRESSKPPTRRLGGQAWTAVTAAVALISAAVALGFQLWPSLKPDPRENLAASVAVFAVDRHVSFGEWLRRTSWTPAVYSRRRQSQFQASGVRRPGDARAVLGLPGELIYVVSEIRGFKRRDTVLRWSMYDARDRRLPEFSDQRAATIRLEAPTDRSFQLLWVPSPQRDGHYHVRVELYTTKGALLAVADSPPFPGR